MNLKGEVMEFYVNPVIEKVEWLSRNSKKIFLTEEPTLDDFNNVGDDDVMLCLIDNGSFTALGVCYNEREFKVFFDKSDSRDKIFAIVRKSKVMEFAPEYKRFLEEN